MDKIGVLTIEYMSFDEPQDRIEIYHANDLAIAFEYFQKNLDKINSFTFFKSE